MIRGLLFGGTLYSLLGVTFLVTLPLRWSRRATRLCVLTAFRIAQPITIFFGGLRIVGSGREHLAAVQGGYILVANHASNLDPLALCKVIGQVDLAFVAKAETMRRPLFGPLAASLGWMGVERDSLLALKRFQEAVKARRKTGWTPNLVIFPEGTRSETGELLPFRIGPFMLAAQTGLPILPVILRGTYPLHPKGAIAVHAGTIRVDIMAPIAPPGGKPKASEILDVVQDLQQRTEALFRAIPDLTVVDDESIPVAKAA